MIHSERATLLPETSVIAVREALALPSRDRGPWQRSVLHSLDDLELSFVAHIRRAERPGGFLDETRADAPRAAHAAETLRHQHEQLRGVIEMARHAVVVLDPDGPTDDAVRIVEETLTLVDAHLEAGNQLAMDIANRDIGGE